MKITKAMVASHIINTQIELLTERVCVYYQDRFVGIWDSFRWFPYIDFEGMEDWMLDRSKCKKMWVWNRDRENPKIDKRIVVEIFKDGSCHCVTKGFEEKFNNGKPFDISYWFHCEEIQEPKKRLMTLKEALDFACKNNDLIFKMLDKGSNYDITNVENYRWAKPKSDNIDWQKFEVEDVD